MFSSLKVKYFRVYWLGMFVSLVGTWIQTVAQSWLVFQLTNSAFLLGVVGFLGSIPIFVLSLFGGVLADRVNKRNILIFTQAAFMLSAFLLALLTQFKFITPWQIMLIAIFNGVIMSFDAPARQSIVVELVGRKHLFNAIALNSVAFNSSRIIGPAVSKDIITPLKMAINIICQGVINLNWVSRANKKAESMKAAWVKINIFLLFTRSAKTPPNRESTKIGIDPKNPTTPRRKAELVSWKTSQLWATV
jgi:MFS family permease